MIKLLYLLVGISLKQTVDELKSLVQEHTATLKERRDSVRTYKPNPAMLAGSAEAHRAMMVAQHASNVAPTLESLSRRILWWRLMPLAMYILTTAVLIWCVVVMENAGIGSDR